MFFACKVCKEKDSRIADLKLQIAFFKSQVSSQTSATEIPFESMEADAILSNQNHIIEIPDFSERAEQTEFESAEDERAERDRILSGNY